MSVDKILVRITCGQMSLIKDLAGVSNRARGLIPSLSLYLHQVFHFLCMRAVKFQEILDRCAYSPKHALHDDAFGGLCIQLYSKICLKRPLKTKTKHCVLRPIIA